jgi:hypothetical protein
VTEFNKKLDELKQKVEKQAPSLLDGILDATEERLRQQRVEKQVAREAVAVEGLSRDPSTSRVNSITSESYSRWAIPFGKHRGTALGDLPTDYLLWCLENMTQLREDARTNITAEINHRDPLILAEPEVFLKARPQYKPARPTLWVCRVCKRGPAENPRKLGCKLNYPHWNKIAEL